MKKITFILLFSLTVLSACNSSQQSIVDKKVIPIQEVGSIPKENNLEISNKIFKGIKNLGFKISDTLAQSLSIYDSTDTKITYFLNIYEQGEFFIHIGEENNDEDSHCFTKEWEGDSIVYTKNYLIGGRKFTEIKYKDYETDQIIIFNTGPEGKCLYIDFNLEYTPEEYWRAGFEEDNYQEMTKKEAEEFIKKNNEIIVDLDKIRARLIKTINFYL